MTYSATQSFTSSSTSSHEFTESESNEFTSTFSESFTDGYSLGVSGEFLDMGVSGQYNEATTGGIGFPKSDYCYNYGTQQFHFGFHHSRDYMPNLFRTICGLLPTLALDALSSCSKLS